jgi:hypothetical protein
MPKNRARFKGGLLKFFYMRVSIGDLAENIVLKKFCPHGQGRLPSASARQASISDG